MGVSSAVIDITKVFKNTSMRTSYFTKTFYLKKDEFCIQRMNKNNK